MTIDSTAATASVSIPGLSFAPHTIMISYVYRLGTEDYLLSIAIKNIDLSSGSLDLGFIAQTMIWIYLIMIMTVLVMPLN